MASTLRYTLLISIFVLFSQFGFGLASTDSVSFGLSKRANISDASEPLDCTTNESGDYYGFGVRLGIYFAWLGSYFANTMLPSEISGSLDTSAIFLVSLLISLFKGSIRGDIKQIDGLMVMHLSSGFLFSCLSVWGYRTLHYQHDGPAGIKHFGYWGTHLRLALVTAISVYGTWFWWEGVDDGLGLADDPRCQVIYTWFFRTWRVGDGINIWYIIVCLCCSMYYGIMCSAAVIGFIFRLFSRKLKPMAHFETGFTVEQLKWLYLVLRLFNLAWIVFCASMVEMTLNRNHMLGVLSQHGDVGYPAQLLPLLVGVLSFVRVLWLIYKEWKEDVSAKKASSDIPLSHFYGAIFGVKKIIAPQEYSHKKDDEPIRVVEQSDISPTPKRPLWLGLLVAWLPWLSELPIWRRYSTDVEKAEPEDALMSYPEDRKERIEAQEEQVIS